MNENLDQSRRRFLEHMSTGLTGVALSSLLSRELQATPLGQTNLPPKAKQVLQIFCPGAASHVDLWDHKPLLDKFDGTPMPGETEVTFQGKNGNLMKSPWPFITAGESGKKISSLLPIMA